jgi:hypothetical protein
MHGQVVAREGCAKTSTEALVEFRGGPSETGIPCPLLRPRAHCG